MKKHPNPKEEKACIIVLDARDTKKRITLCIMPSSLKSDQNIKELRNKWVYDIRFFKEKCQDKKPKNKQEGDENEMKEKDCNADADIQRKQQELLEAKREETLERIQENEEEKKEITIQKDVEKAAKMALEVILKKNK